MELKVSDLIVNQFARNLGTLRGMLLKAGQHAEARKFDENLFLQTRLAPDMYPFIKQVQMTCDTAKGAVARLSGKTAPIFSDDEKSLKELIVRVEKTLEYVRSFSTGDFSAYTTQKITFPWKPGAHMIGADYLLGFAIPNFYFHLTTTYALLRVAGVNIGKSDFIGELPWKN